MLQAAVNHLDVHLVLQDPPGGQHSIAEAAGGLRAPPCCSGCGHSHAGLGNHCMRITLQHSRQSHHMAQHVKRAFGYGDRMCALSLCLEKESLPRSRGTTLGSPFLCSVQSTDMPHSSTHTSAPGSMMSTSQGSTRSGYFIEPRAFQLSIHCKNDACSALRIGKTSKEQSCWKANLLVSLKRACFRCRMTVCNGLQAQAVGLLPQAEICNHSVSQQLSKCIQAWVSSDIWRPHRVWITHHRQADG